MGHGFLDGTCPASFTCPLNDPELQAICARANRQKTSDIGNTPTSSSVAASEPTTAPSVSNSSGYQSNHPSVPSTTGSVSTTSGHYPTSSDFVAAAVTTSNMANTDPALFSPQDSGSTAAAAAAAASSEWPFPTDFDFSSLPPMYPMGDVAYNDLQGFRDDGSGVGGAGGPLPGIAGAAAGAGGHGGGGMWGNTASTSTGTTAMDGVTGSEEAVAAAAAMAGMGAGADEVPWQFGGDFGNDTIWNLLNQFPPY